MANSNEPSASLLESWQKQPPDSPGDWLWVDMWECGSCVHQSGICWVAEESTMESPEQIIGAFGLSWEGCQPWNGLEGITAWRKIELPPAEWADED